MKDVAGLGRVLRLALRRDRFRLPLWTGGVVGFELLMVSSIVSLYPDAAARSGVARTIDNPGSTFLIGRRYGPDDYPWGVMVGHETLVFAGVAIALMAILTTIRHSRAEEVAGRSELVQSGVVGRATGPAVSVLVSVGGVLLTCLMLVGGLTAFGESRLPLVGSLSFAAALASIGVLFTGVGALFAQLASTARGAVGSGAAVLAASFMIRGLGDVRDDRLGWLSPLGWAQLSEPWHTNRWAPLAIGVVGGGLLVALAGWLQSRRDMGAGMLPVRRGALQAGPALLHPVGLALRLNRTAIVAWTLGMAVFGFAYGPVLTAADTFLDQLPQLDDMVSGASQAGGARLFASIIVGMGALLSAVPAVQAVVRSIADERAGRASILLTSVARLRWYLAIVATALAAGALPLVAFGFSFALSGGGTQDDGELTGDIARAAAAYLPAVAVMIAVAALLAGWLPRAAGLAWVPVAHAAVGYFFAELLDWPPWVTWFSPIEHVAARPAIQGDGSSLLALSTIALGLAVVGAVGYRSRTIG